MDALESLDAMAKLPSPTPFVVVPMSVGEAERAKLYAGPELDGELDENLYEIFERAIAKGPFFDFDGRPFGSVAASDPRRPVFIPNPFGLDDDEGGEGGGVAPSDAIGNPADLLGRMLDCLKWLDGFGGRMAVHPEAYPWQYLDRLGPLGLVDAEAGEDGRTVFAITEAGREQLGAAA